MKKLKVVNLFQKSIKERKFPDPELQKLKEKINASFQKMSEALHAEIQSIQDGSIEKGGTKKGQQRSGHKYIKRTGGPGNYRYWYKDEKTGKLFSSDKPNGKSSYTKPQGPKPGSKIIVSPIERPSASVNKKFTGTNEIRAVMNEAIKAPKSSYKASPISKKVNLVGDVRFGKAPKALQEKLHKGLNAAEQILHDSNVVMKTPINFYSGNLETNGELGASYVHLVDNGKFSHNIKFMQKNNLSKALMHEIGHAIDFSMSASKNLKPRSMEIDEMEGPLKADFINLRNLVTSTPYYKYFKDRGSARTNEYLNDSSEVFARAFEIYSYKKAQDLAAAGKISTNFVKDFFPDLHRAGKVVEFKRTMAYKRLEEENKKLNDQKISLLLQRHKQTSEQGLAEVQKQLRALEEKHATLKDKFAKEKQIFDKVSERGYKPIKIKKDERAQITDQISDAVARILKNDTIKKSIG